MAKLDLRMQFNDQCFLIENTGIPHKAVTLGRETNALPDPAPENRPKDATDFSGPGGTNTVGHTKDEAQRIKEENEKAWREAQEKAKKEESQAPPADPPEPPGQGGGGTADEKEAESKIQNTPAALDEFVIYSGAGLLTSDITDNIITSDPGYIFQNYFENYFKAAEFLGLNKAPPVDFVLYKSYNAQKAAAKQVDVKMPINAAFQNLTYDDSMSGIGKGSSGLDYSGLANFGGTPIGHAQVTDLSVTFSGKDFATDNIAELDLTIEVDSLQSLMRRTRAKGSDGETYLVSISDLLRQPSMTEDIKTTDTANEWEKLRQDIEQKVGSGKEATPEDILNSIGYNGLSKEAAQSLAEQYNSTVKVKQSAADKTSVLPDALRNLMLGGLNIGVNGQFGTGFADPSKAELERFFIAKSMENQLAKPSQNCPITSDSTTRKKVDNPGFYQIKLEWGYTEDDTGSDIWANPSAFQALRSALYLTLYAYEIDYTSEGSITLNLKYTGSPQNVLDSPQSNILKLTKDEEKSLNSMREMQNNFKGLASEVKKGDYVNINTKAEQSAALLRDIPGITSGGASGPAIQHSVLQPLWKEHPASAPYFQGEGKDINKSSINPFNDPKKQLDDAYWSNLSSFMSSAINHFLTYTRQKRYGKLYNILMKEQRIYLVDVPYNYIGFDKGLMDLLQTAGDLGKCDDNKKTAPEPGFLEKATNFVGEIFEPVSETIEKKKAEDQEENEQKQKAQQAQETGQAQTVAGDSAGCAISKGAQAPLEAQISENLKKMNNNRAAAGAPGAGQAGTIPPPITSTTAANQKPAQKVEAEDLLKSVRVVQGPETHSFNQTVAGKQIDQIKKKLDSGNTADSTTDTTTEGTENKPVQKPPDPNALSQEVAPGGLGTTTTGLGTTTVAQSNIRVGENKGGDKRKVYFTTVGHVLESVCKIAEFRSSTTGKPDGALAIKIITGPLESHGHMRQNQTDEVKAVDFPIENIGDVPIAMTLLQKFWMEKVVKRGRESYSLNQFIRDFIEYFLGVALGKQCNVQNGTRTNKITADYIQSKLDIGNTPNSRGLGDIGRFIFPKLPFFTPKPDDGMLSATPSWPSPWKRSVGKKDMVALYKESRLQRADSSTDVTTYIVIRAESFALSHINPTDLFGNKPKVSLPIVIPPKRVDNASGKVRKLKFKRAEQPFVREARMTGDNNIQGGFLRDIYDADVEILGVPTFRPGTLIYIDPVMHVGKFADDPLVTLNMVNNILGMGGFYEIIKARHNIVNGKELKYTTELDAIWNSFGGCAPKPVKAKPPAAAADTSGAQKSKATTPVKPEIGGVAGEEGGTEGPGGAGGGEPPTTADPPEPYEEGIDGVDDTGGYDDPDSVGGGV